MLLEAGADIDKVQPDTGTLALHMAAQMGHDEVIHVLVRAGANVDKRAVNGETPLYMAASRGEARVVGTLLRANADPLLEHRIDFICDRVDETTRYYLDMGNVIHLNESWFFLLRTKEKVRIFPGEEMPGSPRVQHKSHCQRSW